jgi:hypothetical protein
VYRVPLCCSMLRLCVGPPSNTFEFIHAQSQPPHFGKIDTPAPMQTSCRLKRYSVKPLYRKLLKLESTCIVGLPSYVIASNSWLRILQLSDTCYRRPHLFRTQSYRHPRSQGKDGEPWRGCWNPSRLSRGHAIYHPRQCT